MLSAAWERKKSDRFVFAPNGSERRATHAPVLGSFGLCDGLIVPVGQAMRRGSVIAYIRISATSHTVLTENIAFYFQRSL